jgi:hypothetical protein
VTTEAVMMERIAGIEEMLNRQRLDVKHEQAHLNEGSRESLYWHYGYMMALKDMLDMLGGGETRQ